MALSLDAKSSVVAIARTRDFNVANVSLPSLLAVALSLEAIAMTRAVGNHLASLSGAVKSRPSLGALARESLAQSVTRAHGLTRAAWLRAVNTSSLGAEALSIEANTSAGAVVGANSLSTVYSGHREGTNLRPLLCAVIGCVFLVALALAINTSTMSVAVVGAVHKLASITMEALVAEAGSVAANAMVRAVSNAQLERAIESRETLIAQAGKVGVACSVSGAFVWAAAVKAVRA